MRLLVGRYILVKQIGKGGFGAVEEYRDRITNETVAIKTIPARYVNQESRRLVRELDIMCFLHDAHPHVIGYFNIFATKANAIPNHNSSANEDPLASVAQDEVSTPAKLNLLGNYYAGLSSREQLHLHQEELMRSVAEITKCDEFNVHIVMPLMKGDLFYFIHLLNSQSSVQRLGVTHQYLAQVAVVFAFQICFGLDYLHQCSIVHRDMKPDNVLVRLDINNPYMSTALIADMGLARDEQHSDTIYICTRYYRPPEVITSVSGGSSKTDIWSLGCVFYEMCTGQTLFTMRSALNDRGEWDGAKASLQLEVILNTIGTPAAEDIERYMPKGNAKLYLQRSAPRPSQLRQLIEKNWILQYNNDEKEKWIDLITRCVVFFPEQRPAAQQLCQHQLFRDYNVFYGTNVQQYPPTPYTPSFRHSADTSRMENKQAMLSLVKRALQETMLPENEEDDSSNEEASKSDSDNSDKTTDTDSDSDDDGDETPQPVLGDTFDISLCTQHQAQSNSAFNPAYNDPRRVTMTSNRDANEESQSGVTTSLFGVSSCTSKSASAPPVINRGGHGNNSHPNVAGKKTCAAPAAHTMVPNSLHQSGTHDYDRQAFLDDDEDADVGANAGLEEQSGSHYLRAELSSGAHHHQQQPGGKTTARFSPGSIFHHSPVMMVGINGTSGKHVNCPQATTKTALHSVSSEESGPVIDDTPPLAPALVFKNRVTCRRQSGAADDEELSLGGTKSSIFDLENLRHSGKKHGPCDDEDDEERMLPQSMVPHALHMPMGHRVTPDDSSVQMRFGVARDSAETPPLPLHKEGNYNYLSQYPLSDTGTGTQLQQQLVPLHSDGSDSGTSLPRAGGNGAKLRVDDSGGRSVSGSANPSTNAQLGNPGIAALPPPSFSSGAQPEQYDYFDDADYFMGNSANNTSKPTVSSSVQKDQTSSAYLFHLSDSGCAVPSLQSVAQQQSKSAVTPPPPPPPPQMRPSATPSLPRMDSSNSFPSVLNPDLRRRYMSYRHSPSSIQAATSAVLEELGSCTHDAERSSELRVLLNYFTSLKVDTFYYI